MNKIYYGFVYITTNLINNKKYIGQKKYDCRGDWKRYLGSGIILKMAVKKHGKENFSREILAYASNSDELDGLERSYIKQYDAVKDHSFYNLVDGGSVIKGELNYFYNKRFLGENNHFYGKRHTLESRLKMSKSHKGQLAWNKGLTNIYSEETLKKMSLVKKGKTMSDEFREKISKATSGKNHPLFGKKHSEKSKEKMREKALGRKLSDETKQKIGDAQRGEKAHNYGKTGSKSHLAKRVVCTTTGMEFGSIVDASKHYNCNIGGVTQCCKGKQGYCGKLEDGTKLVWEYKSI